MNKTKTLLLLFVGMMILTQVHASFGMEIFLNINSDGGVLRYRVNDRDSTRGDMVNMLAKNTCLFGSNVIVQLSYSTNVSVSELIQTISDIQESGFHLIYMMSPGIKNGTNGIFVINLDCSKMLDVMFERQSGFRSTNEYGQFYIITNGVVVPLPPDPPPVIRRLNADVLPDPPRLNIPTRPKIEPAFPTLKKQVTKAP